MPRPSIGRMVHYVSYGTPGGEYKSVCRAAVITIVHSTMPGAHDVIGLAVLNPMGVFFDEYVAPNHVSNSGGTWHWPERVAEEEVDITLTSGQSAEPQR